MLVEMAYAAYLLISFSLMAAISVIYKKHGYTYLLKYLNNSELARSTNNLLLVGFYLLNIGFIAVFLRYGEKPTSSLEVIEFLSTKIGAVSLMLGLFHFFLMKLIESYKPQDNDTTAFGLKAD